jgi:hypothetical protein
MVVAEHIERVARAEEHRRRLVLEPPSLTDGTGTQPLIRVAETGVRFGHLPSISVDVRHGSDVHGTEPLL